MSGIKLVIPHSFTDKKLPVLRADDVLPAAGALLLYDATHAVGSWGAGARAGLDVPNVAAEQAKALTGSALTGILDWATAGDMTVARTAKGGLYANPSTTAPLPQGNYVNLTVPDALAAYLQKNPNHSYYLSQWTLAARKATPGSGAPPFTAAFAKSSGSYLLDLTRSNGLGSYPTATYGANFLGGQPGTVYEQGKTYLHSLGVSGWNGDLPAPGEVKAHPFILGRVGPVQSAHEQPAVILYRVYLEDLTVSGRTYAQASDADNAAYNREVLTAGGRYHGDSY